jgi:hypothetical protein
MLTQLASNTKDSLPLFDFKDTKKSGHDKFKNWFGNLRPWLEVQMQRHLQSIENYPSEVMKFDWLYVDPEKHSTVLSYPTEKPVPPRLGPPNTQAVMLARAKQRKVRRAYNHKIVSLRQAAQQILWNALKQSFETVHSAWFDLHDPWSILEKATREAADLDDAATQALMAEAHEAGLNHGTKIFLKLQAHYVDSKPTGVLSRMIDVDEAENSFDGDWEAYRTKMTNVWHRLRSSVEDYSPEQLQVLKCLTSLINGTPPRLEHWRTWSMNYLLNHGAQPDAWTLEGFLSLGAEHSESQAVTSKSASSRHGQAYRASVNFTQPSRGINKRANRGGRGGAQGARGGSKKKCATCQRFFKPKLPAHQLCDSCHSTDTLQHYVGSQDGGQRLAGRIDKKRKANFARGKRQGGNRRQAQQAAANQAQALQAQAAPVAAAPVLPQGVGAQLPPPRMPPGANLAVAAANAAGAHMRRDRVVVVRRADQDAPFHGHASALMARVNEIAPPSGPMTEFLGVDLLQPPPRGMTAQVERALDEQPFSIPQELKQQVPEHFCILDSGATYHVVKDKIFVLNAETSYHEIMWGNRETSRALAQGSFICSTITLPIDALGTSYECHDYMLQSGLSGSTLYTPAVNRTLLSVARLTREDGHAVRLEGDYPHMVLHGAQECVPLIFADGFWFLPCWPLPHHRVFSSSSPAAAYRPVFPGSGGAAAAASVPTGNVDGEDEDEGYAFELVGRDDEYNDADYAVELVEHDGVLLQPKYASELLRRSEIQNPSSHGAASNAQANEVEALSDWIYTDDALLGTSFQHPSEDLGEVLHGLGSIGIADDASYDLLNDHLLNDLGLGGVDEDEEMTDSSDDESDADDLQDHDPTDDDPPDDGEAGAALAPKKRKREIKKPPLKRGKRLTMSEQRNLRKALQEAHERYGHVDPKKLVCGKTHGRFHSSSIPQRGRTLWSVKDCPICLSMKQQKPPKPGKRPKELLLQDQQDWKPWEKVYADSSGKHRVPSRQGNRYFTIFKCAVTSDRKYYAHKKKSHYTLVFLKLCAELGQWPRILISDQAGEVIKKTLKSWLVPKGTMIQTIPRSEHHFSGSIEIEIKHISNATKCTMASRNIPANLWDIVGEYMTLMDCCTRASPLDKDISCHEAATSDLPDLDLLPPVGCYAIRHRDKLDRPDFKLSPANECGVFIGLAHLGETYGAVLLTETSLVVARDNVSYVKDRFPLTTQAPGHSDWGFMQKMLGYGSSGGATATDIAPPAPAPAASDPGTVEDDDSDIETVDAELKEVLTHMPTAIAVDPVTDSAQPFQAADADALRSLDADISEGSSVAHTRGRRTAKPVIVRPKHVPRYEPKQPDAINIAKPTFAIQDLKANKTLIVGKKLKRHFEGYGGALGTINKYDSIHDQYHLSYADGWEETIQFPDMLRLLPKSWLAKEDKANAKMAMWALARAQSVAEAYASQSTALPPATQVLTEPRSHIEAMHAPDSEEWKIAFDKEWYDLQGKGCFQVIAESDVPKNKSILRSKWVLKLKYRDGLFDKRKARLVICGYDMIKHVDYESSYSPTCSQTSLRLILALTATVGWHSFDYDAQNAFISAALKPHEYLYMRPLPGYDVGAGNVLEVRRNLYGSVEASRKFFLLAKEVYLASGLRQLASDNCVFVRFEFNVLDQSGPVDNEHVFLSGGFNNMPIIPEHERRYKSCPHAIAAFIVLLYVDNTAMRTNAIELRDEFLNAVAQDGRIQLLPEGNLEWFLGVRYSYSPDGAITCDQEAYINTLLHRHGMESCRPELLPLPCKFDIYALPIPEKPDKLLIASYASLVGEMLYVSVNTAPEISQPMHQLTRFMTKASKAHLSYAKHVLKFLKHHRSRKLRWCATDVAIPRSPFTIFGFADSSWADDRLGRKSSMFYALFVNGAAFSWKTQLSSIIATSTAEAELMSLGVAVQEVLWARQLAQELGFAQTMPTVLYEDNEACIKMAHRELNRSRSKHIHIKYSFIHHHYANGTFDPQPIASQDQVADVGTALRPLPQFSRCARALRGEK